MARLVGSTLEPFASVVTSAAPRAIETALAMGYGVDEIVDLPSGYLPGQLAHHDQWHWPQPYRRYAELLALARVGRGRQSSPCPLGPTHRRRTGWRRRDGPVVRAARLSERGSGSLQARGYGFESRWLQLRSVTGSKPFLSKSGRMATSGLSFGLSCPRLSRPGAFIASLRERTRSPADSSEPRFADLESGLGSRPRGFESRILRSCDKGNTPPR